MASLSRSLGNHYTYYELYVSSSSSQSGSVYTLLFPNAGLKALVTITAAPHIQTGTWPTISDDESRKRRVLTSRSQVIEESHDLFLVS